MELEPFSFEQRPENKLAAFSAYASGVSWFVLFSFLFSDNILGLLEGGHNEGALVCAAPLFLLAIGGLATGILTGAASLAQLQNRDESGSKKARAAIMYGIIGIGVLIIAPVLNPILDHIGIQLTSIADIFP